MRSGVGRTLLNGSREVADAHSSQFCVGGVSVGIAGERGEDVTVVPPLKPFLVETGASDISMRVGWLPEITPASGRQLFDSGCTWRLYEGEAGFQFDFHTPVLGVRPYKRLLVDRRFREATLQMSEECVAIMGHSLEPLGYPLDELLIMHRLTQEKAIELHSCGIVRADGTGNLFVGHSGAGKSTTTRLWTQREEVEVLSDDRIIVRRDGAEMLDEAAGSAGAKQVLRLRDCSASRGNHFAQDDKKSKMRMYGTPWHGEAMYASPGSAPLARIFVLEHGRGNVLTRLSPSQAVGELFARSFVPFHRHEYVDSALEFLQELVDSVPCYRYAFEPDERAVEAILNFQD